jgi:hypothetical protein
MNGRVDGLMISALVSLQTATPQVTDMGRIPDPAAGYPEGFGKNGPAGYDTMSTAQRTDRSGK